MGFIAEEIIAQVLERSGIVETISGYIPLKRAGRNFKANCPFHNERTPSFVVNPDKQIFHCFGCGVGGNVISFVMQQERLEFPEAVRLLAQKAGIAIPVSDAAGLKSTNVKQSIYAVNDLSVAFYHQILIFDKDPSVAQAREYLKNRGITLEMVKKFKIGFALDQWESLISFLKKKDLSLKMMEQSGLVVVKENRDGFYDRFRNRIMFPIFNAQNQCLAFGARTMKDGLAKYINSPETPVYTKGNHLYGCYMSKDAVSRLDSVIVVEGYLDFIMPFQAGVENIVASLGTALTVEQIRLIRRYTKNIVMLFDADQAGQSAIVRSLDLLIEEGMNVKVATLTSGDDPDSFIRRFGVEAFQEKIYQAQSFFDFKLNQLMLKYDAKTVEGRAQISTEMLPMINKFRNEVIKFGYLKQLADKLFTPEQVLALELQKIPSGAQKTPMRDGQAPITNQQPQSLMAVFNGGIRAAEYHVLRLVLDDVDLIPATKDEVDLNDFQDEDIRIIMQKIFELFDKGLDVNFQNLTNCFKDPRILQNISQLMVLDDFPVADKIKMHRDCINRLKLERRKLQRKGLVDQIRYAEISGNHNRVDELKEKFNQLIKG